MIPRCDRNLRGFDFRVGRDIEDLLDIEELFPNLEQLRERIDPFNERFGELAQRAGSREVGSGST